jgi:hypothetical protein
VNYIESHNIRLRLLLGGVSLALSCGCTHNSVLYNEARDKQGQEVVKAVGEAHVTGTVELLEKTFADIAAREEAGARNQQEKSFDWELARVARAPSLNSTLDGGATDGLIPTLTMRLTKLGLKAKSDEELKRLDTLEANIGADKDQLRNAQISFLETTGHEFSSCADVYAASKDPANHSGQPSEAFLKSLPEKSRERAPPHFADLIGKCVSFDEHEGQRAAFYSDTGLIRTAYDDVGQKEQQIAAYEVSQRNAKRQVDAAIAAESTQEAADQAGKSQLAQAQEQANRVLAILDQAGTVNQAGGAHLLATERLEHLEALVAAIAGQPPGDNAKLTHDELVSVAIIRDIPSLAAEADKALKEAKKPRLVPLLAAIDYQKLVLGQVEAEEKTTEKELLAARNRLDALRNETMALVSVLRPIQSHPNWSESSIASLDKGLPAKEKRLLYAALATYSDEVKQQRIDAAVWQVRERTAVYERTLVISKYSAAKWDSLMDLMAKVLADYHAAGIKTSDVTEFFKALGLVGIAVGVAQ